MNDVRVVTNNVPRFTIDAYELTAREREQFDYHDWNAIDEGRDSATFFRYKGELYDLANFMRTAEPGWDGMESDSFFSATVVRLIGDDRVVVGRMYS